MTPKPAGLAVQLAVHTEAAVIGLASRSHQRSLEEHGVVAVEHGDGVAEQIRGATGGQVDGFVGAFGGGHVEMVVELGVKSDRVDVRSARSSCSPDLSRSHAGQDQLICTGVPSAV